MLKDYKGVQVFAGDRFNDPANARYKNLKYETLPDGSEELATIPVWGPTWRVTFDLKITAFPTHWAGILHFTTGENCCKIGDRIPFVKLHKDNQLVILNAANNQGNHQTRVNLEVNRWYNIEISQTKDTNNDGSNFCKLTEMGCTPHFGTN